MSATVTASRALGITSGNLGKNNFDRRYRRYYSVTLSEADPISGWVTACTNTSVGDHIPQRGTQDSVTPNGYVLDNGADPEAGDASGINYVVWAEFGSDQIAGSNIQPWSRKDMVKRSSKVYQVPMISDWNTDPAINGGQYRPVVNSAGDRPANPLMMEVKNPLMTIRRARRAIDFDPDAAQLCQNSINESDFTLATVNGDITVTAGTALLHEINADDARFTDTFPGTSYFDITMIIERQGLYPPGSYNLKMVEIADEGFKHWITPRNPDPTTDNPADKILATDTAYDATETDHIMKGSDGLPIQFPVTAPVFLYSDGTRLPANASFDDLLNAKKQFTRYPTKDWSDWIT